MLDQVPNVEVVANTAVLPTQTLSEPVIAAGNGFTVIGVSAKQPVGIRYEMLAAPAKRPDTIPESEPTVAIAGLLLTHTPPDIVLASVVVAPAHNAAVPVLAGGWVFTLTSAVDLQPVDNS